jgi:hypothetical protein
VKRCAAILSVTVVISLLSLTGVACSGGADEDVSEEQTSGSVEIMGRVEDVQGSVLTLTTFDDTVTVLIGGASSVQRMCEGDLNDIAVGENITALGRTDEGGVIEAASIAVTAGSMTSPLGRPGGIRPSSESPGDFVPPDGTRDPGFRPDRERPEGFEGFPGGGGASGTVEKIEGNELTLATNEGTATVMVGDETSVQTACEGSLTDITVGDFITVSGKSKDDGSVEATAISIVSSAMGPGFRGR